VGLHDRIKSGNGIGNGNAAAEHAALSVVAPHQRESSQPTAVDPYAELKTRVHHACIAKLGPQLFSSETTENLTDQVMRAVTEQLALDRTPPSQSLPRTSGNRVSRLQSIRTRN
jgi:hypothetical protein